MASHGFNNSPAYEPIDVIKDSIIMNHATVGANCVLTKAIVSEYAQIGDNVIMGEGEEVDNETHPHIYNQGLVCIGENTVIPSNIKIGKNTVVSGITTAEDYPDNCLESGKSFIKAGEKA